MLRSNFNNKHFINSGLLSLFNSHHTSPIRSFTSTTFQRSVNIQLKKKEPKEEFREPRPVISTSAYRYNHRSPNVLDPESLKESSKQFEMKIISNTLNSKQSSGEVNSSAYIPPHEGLKSAYTAEEESEPRVESLLSNDPKIPLNPSDTNETNIPKPNIANTPTQIPDSSTSTSNTEKKLTAKEVVQSRTKKVREATSKEKDKEIEKEMQPSIDTQADYFSNTHPKVFSHPEFEPVTFGRPILQASDCPDEVELSAQQKALVELLEEGRNVYFTGKAGTGKTFALQHFIRSQRRQARPGLAVTAPTGIAAVQIEGDTINSYFGIRPEFMHQPDKLARFLNESERHKHNYKSTNVLIIDEVSMLNPELLNLVEMNFRRLRKNDKPFGGVQVILTGDFFQLPPVFDGDPNAKIQQLDGSGRIRSMNDTPYSFQSSSWKSLNGEMVMVELTEVFRQSDPKFIALLDEIRVGHVSDKTLEILKSRVQTKEELNINEYTFLTAYRADAASHNQKMLDEIAGEPFEYNGIDEVYEAENEELMGLAPPKAIPNAVSAFASTYREFTVPPVVKLKKGAKVILTKNIDPGKGLINGSQGVVIGFQKAMDRHLGDVILQPIVRFNHYDRCDFGIGYHRFSRLSHTADTRRDLGYRGKARLVRCQIPLALGWAITVHRSQGMTLDKVYIDVKKPFVPGHLYVALSRVKSLEGLKIAPNHWRIESFKASRDVKMFYDRFKETDLVALRQKITR